MYDRARPPYPPPLWERLLPLVAPGTRVLDLGAGTGQATGPLVAAGAVVTAVEPGPALAAILRRRFPDVTVLESSAESVDLDPGSFELAVVATAVHWFDLSVVLPALHRAVAPGGHLAVWRNAFGDPTVARTAFRERVAEITGRRNTPPRPGPGELDTRAWADRLGATGHFVVRDVQEFRWTIELDAGQVHDLFSTFSDWSPSEVEEVAGAVTDLGGFVTENYVTPLVLLARAGSPS